MYLLLYELSLKKISFVLVRKSLYSILLYIGMVRSISVLKYLSLKKMAPSLPLLFPVIPSIAHLQTIFTISISLGFVHISILLILPSTRIFLGILGFALSILFCTTFCRACSRIREQQLERETWRRNEHDGRPPPIYFIPFPRSVPQHDSEDHLRVSQCSQELHTPPRYSTAVYCGLPPSYNEVSLHTNPSVTDTK